MTRVTDWAVREGEITAGFWSQLGPQNLGAMSQTGFDWIGIDAQHGLFDERAVFEGLQSVGSGHPDVLVRVPENSDAWIGRVLDAGARGVIVPMVDTPEQAGRAARAARFPPFGHRSFGPIRVPWGRSPQNSGREQLDALDTRAVVAVMIETRLGLSNLEEIADSPGVDMVFVGPWDLSIALGTTLEQMVSQGADSALAHIADTCRRSGVLVGAYAGSDDFARFLYGLGYQVLATVSDVGLLSSASPPA